MPPTLYLMRHAEGEHNVNRCDLIRDALLTATGESQCLRFRAHFPLHESVSVIMSSPLRRTIQTAALAFDPALRRENVGFLLVPLGQEVSGAPCDWGQDRVELEEQVPSILAGKGIGFDISKIDYSLVEEGWNVKTGKWAPDSDSLARRAAALRSWLYNRPEQIVVLVSHGAFIHYITEDWTGDDPTIGTGWKHCEMRIYNFFEAPESGNVHLVETEMSKASRVPSVRF